LLLLLYNGHGYNASFSNNISVIVVMVSFVCEGKWSIRINLPTKVIKLNCNEYISLRLGITPTVLLVIGTDCIYNQTCPIMRGFVTPQWCRNCLPYRSTLVPDLRPVISGVRRVPQSFVFFVVFSRSLFVLFLLVMVLFVFRLTRPLATPLLSSNSSCL